MEKAEQNIRIALIPSYEPEMILVDIVEKLKAAAFEVVVVNDGSGDAYAHIFSALGGSATVLSYETNCGKGHALKFGFQHILEHYDGKYTVVTLDSDGQHGIEDVIHCCKEAECDDNTLVLGGRHWDKTTPLRSRFGNFCTRVVYRLATGESVYDTQTGLRAFQNSLLPFMLEVEGERFEYEMKVLLLAPRKHIDILEVPIQTIYLDGNSGSHFDKFKDSFRIYKVILGTSGSIFKEVFKFLFSSLLAFGIDYLMFCLLTLFLTGATFAYKLTLINVIARVISASVNYTVNYHIVFKSKKSVLKSAAEYFLLAVIILIGNTFVLNILVSHIDIAPMLAKLITEIVFVVFSWLLQRFFVFKNRKHES